MFEIYGQKIIDVLSDVPAPRQKCVLRYRKDGTTFVSNLLNRTVKQGADVEAILASGERNRQVAATALNSTSSRSHLVMELTVTGKDQITGEVTNGHLTLVDLAGSERVSKSKATGDRLAEANAINTSLSALGQVFLSLQKGGTHIPYRNSLL